MLFLSFLRLLKNIILRRREYLPSFKKRFASFGEGSVIHYPSLITEHENISIGKNTTILANSRIQIYNALTGREAKIAIGSNCYFGFHLTILAGGSINIGDDVLIASNVLITSENHGMNPESKIPYINQPLECKDVSIGEGSWIGEKVSVMPGVKIGKKCVIGTNAVVTKSIPDYSMALGILARVIKKWNFEKHEWEKV